MGDSLDMLFGEVKFSGIQTQTVEVEYTDHLTTSTAFFVSFFTNLTFLTFSEKRWDSNCGSLVSEDTIVRPVH